MKTIRLLLFLSWAMTGYAQTPDTARTAVTTEVDTGTAARPGSQFMKAYRQFIRAQVEETTLVKVSGYPTFGYAGFLGPAFGANTQLAVEQKLTPAFSVLGGLGPVFGWIGESRESQWRTNLAGRWYYNLNRRIRQGKSANNFSDQYLTLHSNNTFLTQTRNRTTGETVTTRGGNHVLSVGIGAQRRLGRFSFIDVNIGPGWLTNRVNPYSSRFVLSAGLAVGLGL